MIAGTDRDGDGDAKLRQSATEKDDPAFEHQQGGPRKEQHRLCPAIAEQQTDASDEARRNATGVSQRGEERVAIVAIFSSPSADRESVLLLARLNKLV